MDGRCMPHQVMVPFNVQDEESQRIKQEQSKLLRAMDCFSEGVMLINVERDTWEVMFINEAFTRITGVRSGRSASPLSAAGSAA